MVIRVTAPKVSAIEKASASLASDSVSKKAPQKEDIPCNLRISKTNDDEWIEHDTPRGVISYSAQYSDNKEVFRHIRVSTRIFREVERLLAQRPNRLLTREDLSTHLQIPMSTDWRHYHTHTRAKVLLFKRPRRDSKL